MLDEATVLDPQYQVNMMLIEDALRETGMTQPDDFVYPDVYDDQLLELINSIPLE